MSISENGHLFTPQAVGLDLVIVPFAFTTSASGVPSLTTGTSVPNLTIENTTGDTYVATLTDWGKTAAVVVRHDQQDTIGHDLTESAASGTVTIAFDGAFDSKRCDVVLFAYETADQGV